MTVSANFLFSSLVMEEAGQVLEVETLVPMLLQRTENFSDCRLSRIVLIGDHLQLPPVVKNNVFRSYSHLDQSLFSRLVRMGVPATVLDKQGRCRPQIAELFNYRYSSISGMKSLGNLDTVFSLPEYLTANAGLLHPFQVIDVPAFKGRGEFCPTPHFYQNLGEAEYVVAVYQFMRLMGHPAKRISILTTYNGQKQLIRDIVQTRCKGKLFGAPAIISTVDKYQGQQNDIVLLSLVRTASVGYLRDVRRLVVALSRARLGLYIFCRQELFENCLELAPAFNLLKQRSTSALQLVIGESHPTARAVDDNVGTEKVFEVSDVTAMGVLVYQMLQQAGKDSTAVSTTAGQLK